jgi:hypothetical protein
VEQRVNGGRKMVRRLEVCYLTSNWSILGNREKILSVCVDLKGKCRDWLNL